MQVVINIVQPIKNHLDEWDTWVDAFELLGAKADDYDPDTKVVSLIVDEADTEADYDIHGGIYAHEIQGATHMIEEIEITIRECKWQDYDIINAEQVCATIEGFDYVN